VDANGVETPSAVDVFDPTRDALGGGYGGAMSTVAGAVVSATTPDGTTLILGAPDATGWALYFVATSDHQTALREPLGLRQKPSDLVVSPSGRYAVVAHGETDVGGLSVIDLSDPDPVRGYRFVGLGQVDRVVVAPVAADSDLERAYALLEQGFDCDIAGVQSRVVTVELETLEPGSDIAFGGLIRDIAASSQQPFVVVANGCENKVERIEPGDGVARVDLVPVPDVTAVAVIDGKVWSVGSDELLGGLARQMSLVSRDIDSEEVTSLELPLLEERATTDTFTNSGDEAFRQIVADTIRVVDLAVLPGAESIALMTHGEFIAENVYGTIGTNEVLVLPSMQITNNEYLLIDTATNSLVQRTRASCQVDVLTPDALVGEGWKCQDGDPLVPYVPDGPTGFVPTSLSVLYEAR
jgi:DNA-binding beta-propeller fold protein YncE